MIVTGRYRSLIISRQYPVNVDGLSNAHACPKRAGIVGPKFLKLFEINSLQLFRVCVESANFSVIVEPPPKNHDRRNSVVQSQLR